MRFANPSRRLALKTIERTPPGIDDGMAHGFPVARHSEWSPIFKHPGWPVALETAPLVRVPLASLVATQDDVARLEVARHITHPQLVAPGTTFRGRFHDKPIVVRYLGVLYIIDGHHRLEAARRKGRDHARVRLADLDAWPDENPQPLPLPLKLAAGALGLLGLGTLVNWFVRKKMASALTNALPPGTTVNPPPPVTIAMGPKFSGVVQLAAAGHATAFNVHPSVELTFDTAPGATTLHVTQNPDASVDVLPTSTGATVTGRLPGGVALVTVGYLADPSGKSDAVLTVGVVG